MNLYIAAETIAKKDNAKNKLDNHGVVIYKIRKVEKERTDGKEENQQRF